MAASVRESAQAALQRLVTTCTEFIDKYQQLIVRDPDLTYKLETGLRVVSYLFPGGRVLESIVDDASTRAFLTL